MSQSAAFWWSLVRAIVLASVAIPLSKTVVNWSRGQRLRLCAALVPLFVPDLLVGFTYRITATRLAQNEIATELLYAGLLLLRIVALQVGIRWVFPVSPQQFESVATWKLIPQSKSVIGVWHLWRLMLAGPWRTMSIAWLAGLLLSFQDFETAALVQVNSHPISWTVSLFDARAANESWFQLLKLSLRPVVAQALIFLILHKCIRNYEGVLVLRSSFLEQRRSVFSDVVSVMFVAVGLFVLVAWPLFDSFGECVVGLRSLWVQDRLGTIGWQVSTSFGFGLLAAAMSLWIVQMILDHRWSGMSVCVLPAMSGSLLLSLLLVACFQLPLANLVYDTWLPMVVGQTLLLLPKAWLLGWLIQVIVSRESEHSVALLNRSGERAHQQAATHIGWQMLTSRRLLAAALLAHWAFWDVAVVSALRPVGFEPAICRLYAEMHYDHTDTLMAMTAMSVVVPCLLIAAAALAGRFVAAKL